MMYLLIQKTIVIVLNNKVNNTVIPMSPHYQLIKSLKTEVLNLLILTSWLFLWLMSCSVIGVRWMTFLKKEETFLRVMVLQYSVNLKDSKYFWCLCLCMLWSGLLSFMASAMFKTYVAPCMPIHLKFSIIYYMFYRT